MKAPSVDQASVVLIFNCYKTSDTQVPAHTMLSCCNQPICNTLYKCCGSLPMMGMLHMQKLLAAALDMTDAT